MTTYYVRTGGSDAHPCSGASTNDDSHAKQTIAAGIGCAGAAGGTNGAGNTVEVAAGTYNELQITGLPGGSAGNPFTLKCATSRGCTWNLTGTNFHLNIGSPSTNYVTIQDFVFAGNKTGTPGVGEGGGIAFSASLANTHTHINFLNNEVKNAGRHDGMSITGTSNMLIQNCYIHDTGGYVSPEDPTNATFHHGIYFSTNADHNTVDSCTIQTGTGYGIQNYPYGDGVNSNIFSRNVLSGHATAGTVLQGDNLQFFDNVVYSNGSPGANGGIYGFGGSILVYANTVYNNTGPGINMQNGAGTECTNNLVISNSGTAITGCPSTLTNVSTGTAASHFVTPGSDFHLKTGSSAIGAGTNLSATFTTDLSGNTRVAPWDVGAYKFITAAASIITKVMSHARRRH